MMRTWISKYYPHVLLLTSAAACLAIVLAAPQRGHTPSYVWPSQKEARLPSAKHTAVQINRFEVRSLAEILQQANARLQRLNQNQSEAHDELNNEQTSLAADNEDAPQRRMVRRQDIAALPEVSDPFYRPFDEYIDVSDPLAWRRPDRIAPREYLILAYGEVGQVQADESSSDNDETVETPQTPAATDVVATFGDADTPSTEPASTAIAALPVTLITASSSTAVATQITPVSVQQSASLSAPTPLASRTASKTTRSEPIQTGKRHQPDQTVSVSTRPVSVDTPARSAVPSEPSLAKYDHASESKKPDPKANKRGVEQPIVKKTAHKDTKPKVSPASHDRPGPTQIASKPPADTPSIKAEETKPDRHTGHPTPAEIVSAKPLLDKQADPAPRGPAKTASKPTNPLVVLIDDYDTIGSDRMNAIDNALSRINQAAKKANTGIEFSVTTDKNSDYNILFREDDSKSMGNKLGLAEFAVTEDKQGNEIFLGENDRALGGKAQVSINKSFDWFTGDDENDIGDTEYDYITAVEHEFLHLFGLDDDFDHHDTVSHGQLSPGETRRDIDSHEINEIAGLFASNDPWQSQPNPASWASNSRGKVHFNSKALVAAVPEPASAALMGVAVLLGVARRRR
jgi:hypothetical protein